MIDVITLTVTSFEIIVTEIEIQFCLITNCLSDFRHTVGSFHYIRMFSVSLGDDKHTVGSFHYIRMIFFVLSGLGQPRS